MSLFRNPLARKTCSVVAGVILVATVGATLAPQRAHAVWGVADLVIDWGVIGGQIVDWGSQVAQEVFAGNLSLKEYTLDSIAKFAAVVALQSVTQSMLNWAATGFDGSPSFETDLQRSFLRVGDTVAQNFQRQLDSGSIASPFSTGVAQAVINKYYRETGRESYANRARFTLGQNCLTGNNIFDSCGISGWMQSWLNPANNPFGAQLLAEDELAGRITGAIDIRLKELDWGNGFLAWKSCPEGADIQGAADITGASLAEVEKNLGCSTKTPGSVLANAVNTITVDAGIGQLVNADEINEIISAFFTNLITDTLFGDDDGLGGSGSYERPAKLKPSNEMVSSVLQSINNIKPRLVQFRDNWNQLYQAALEAESLLNSCSSNRAEIIREEDVVPVINDALENIERAESGLASLEDLEDRIRAAQQGEGDFQDILNDFQQMQQDGTLPSVQEFTFAFEQVQSAPSPAPETMMRRMLNISGSTCFRLFIEDDDD